MSYSFELYEDGVLDEMGEYIGEDHPPARKFKGHTDKYCKTKGSPYNGITKWLGLQGSRKYMSMKNTAQGKWEDLIIREYADHLSIKEVQFSSKNKMRRICTRIQQDFPAFIAWYNTAHPPNFR